MSKKNTIKKYQIKRDCWDLDIAFLKWLRERLPVYLHDAGKFVDLTYYKFEYEGREYTQEELIKYLIRLLDEMPSFNLVPEWDTYISKILDVWKLLFPAMWW